MPGFALKKALNLTLKPESSEHFGCLTGSSPLWTSRTYEVVTKHVSSGVGKGFFNSCGKINNQTNK